MRAYKKITKSGSVTLPRQIRQELGMLPGVALELTATENGELLMRKRTPSCRLCGSADHVVTHNGMTLCRGCLAAFDQEVNQNA